MVHRLYLMWGEYATLFNTVVPTLILLLFTIWPFMVPCMVVISCIPLPTIIACPFNLSSALGIIPTACGVMWTVAVISPLQMQGISTIAPCLGKTSLPIQIPTLYSTADLLLPLLIILELFNWSSSKQGEYQSNITQIWYHHLSWCPHGRLPDHCDLDNSMASWPHFLAAPSIQSSNGLAFHSGCNLQATQL